MNKHTQLFLFTALLATVFGDVGSSQQAPAVNRTALRGATAIDVVAGQKGPAAANVRPV